MARGGVNRGKVEDIERTIATKLRRNWIADVKIYVLDAAVGKSRLGDVDTVEPCVSPGLRQPPQKMAADEACTSKYRRAPTYRHASLRQTFQVVLKGCWT
jgi:hypothetical protein